MKFVFVSSTEDPMIGQLKKDLESTEGEDSDWIKWRINELKTQSSLINQLLQTVPSMRAHQLREWLEKPLESIPLPQRWMIYIAWKRITNSLLDETSRMLERKYHELVKRLQDARAVESAEVCGKVHVVGITTTGAAKQRGFLNRLKSKIGTKF